MPKVGFTTSKVALDFRIQAHLGITVPSHLKPEGLTRGNFWPCWMPWMNFLGSTCIEPAIQVHLGFRHLRQLCRTCLDLSLGLWLPQIHHLMSQWMPVFEPIMLHCPQRYLAGFYVRFPFEVSIPCTNPRALVNIFDKFFSITRIQGHHRFHKQRQWC